MIGNRLLRCVRMLLAGPVGSSRPRGQVRRCEVESLESLESRSLLSAGGSATPPNDYDAFGPQYAEITINGRTNDRSSLEHSVLLTSRDLASGGTDRVDLAQPKVTARGDPVVRRFLLAPLSRHDFADKIRHESPRPVALFNDSTTTTTRLQELTDVFLRRGTVPNLTVAGHTTGLVPADSFTSWSLADRRLPRVMPERFGMIVPPGGAIDFDPHQERVFAGVSGMLLPWPSIAVAISIDPVQLFDLLTTPLEDPQTTAIDSFLETQRSPDMLYVPIETTGLTGSTAFTRVGSGSMNAVPTGTSDASNWVELPTYLKFTTPARSIEATGREFVAPSSIRNAHASRNGLDEWDADGLIELEAPFSRGRLGNDLCKPLAAVDSSGESVRGSAGQPAPKVDPQTLRDIQRMPAVIRHRSDQDEQKAGWTSSQDEVGGMIELVAANLSQSVPPFRTTDGRAGLRGRSEGVQVDVSVGLYQVFELASLGDDPVRTNEHVSETSDPSSSRSAPIDKASEAASEDDDSTGRPSLATAVLSTASLVVGYMIHARTVSDSKAHRWDANGLEK